jgi:DNA-directed RNA polymerase subunit L
MNIEILKEEKDMIKIKLENDNATFGYALADELWITKGVDAAVVSKKHPLIGKPELLVQGKDAKKLVKTAAQSFKKKVEEAEKSFLKQI